MVSKRRLYTREFKIETVNLISCCDHSVTEVATRDEKAYAIGRDTGYLIHGHPSGYLSSAFMAKLAE